MKTTNSRPTLPFMDVEDLASATECTGLIPSGIQTPEEGEAYAQMYAIHQQKPARESKNDEKPKFQKEGR